MRSTCEVLNAIGTEGVVVGSVAYGKPDPKDIDVVVRETKPEEGRNEVFRRLVRTFPDCESLGPAHLWIDADPLPVEVFCYTCFHAIDPRKDAGMVTYRKARRNAIRREVFGTQMFVHRDAVNPAQRES